MSESATPAAAASTLKLLVVDDEPAMLRLLKDSFESGGHRVLEASSAEQALEVLDKEPVDLVLTDQRMQGMTGTELLLEIGKRRLSTGVILITGFATLESAMEAMRLGALDVVQKPLNLSELNEKIARYAQKRRLHTPSSAVLQATKPRAKEEPAMPTKTPEEAVEVQRVDLPAIGAGSTQDAPQGIDKILDIPVLAMVRLGKTSLQIADLLRLGVGSVVELDKHAGDPVELLVNNKLVALGEVVVVNDTFGFRVTKILDPKQRIQQLA